MTGNGKRYREMIDVQRHRLYLTDSAAPRIVNPKAVIDVFCRDVENDRSIERHDRRQREAVLLRDDRIVPGIDRRLRLAIRKRGDRDRIYRESDDQREPEPIAPDSVTACCDGRLWERDALPVV